MDLRRDKVELGEEGVVLHWWFGLLLESGELVLQRDSECGIDDVVEKIEKLEVILGLGLVLS